MISLNEASIIKYNNFNNGPITERLLSIFKEYRKDDQRIILFVVQHDPFNICNSIMKSISNEKTGVVVLNIFAGCDVLRASQVNICSQNKYLYFILFRQ